MIHISEAKIGLGKHLCFR